MAQGEHGSDPEPGRPRVRLDVSWSTSSTRTSMSAGARPIGCPSRSSRSARRSRPRCASRPRTPSRGCSRGRRSSSSSSRRARARSRSSSTCSRTRPATGSRPATASVTMDLHQLVVELGTEPRCVAGGAGQASGGRRRDHADVVRPARRGAEGREARSTCSAASSSSWCSCCTRSRSTWRAAAGARRFGTSAGRSSSSAS